jgi:hypothetical protein
MSQYHWVVNLDKREFLNGLDLGRGARLVEQVGTMKCTATALWLLLTASNKGGGGEAYDHPFIGRWAGDRIAVIGDSAEPEEVPGVNAAQIMELINTHDEGYVDISNEARSLVDTAFPFS